MVDPSRPRSVQSDYGSQPVRPDGSGAMPLPPGAPGKPARRQRIPSPAALAALIVNGILTLPRHYRRGMFLDIIV